MRLTALPRAKAGSSQIWFIVNWINGGVIEKHDINVDLGISS